MSVRVLKLRDGRVITSNQGDPPSIWITSVVLDVFFADKILLGENPSFVAIDNGTTIQFVECNHVVAEFIRSCSFDTIETALNVAVAENRKLLRVLKSITYWRQPYAYLPANINSL